MILRNFRTRAMFAFVPSHRALILSWLEGKKVAIGVPDFADTE